MQAGVHRPLTRLTDCLSSLTDLGLAVALLAKDISQTDTGLVRTQLRRQTDVWTLLSATVSHRPASDLGLVELGGAGRGRTEILL